MCVFMSPGRLSWLHKIELVISNISSPKGDWVGEEEQGRAGMVASCQQGTSLGDSERERGCDVNVPQNQIDACPNPQ